MESTPSSTSQLGGECLAFVEAVKILPEFLLQPPNQDDDDEPPQLRHQEVASLLSQVDCLHNPYSSIRQGWRIFNYTLGVVRAATGHVEFQFRADTLGPPLTYLLRCEWEVTIQTIITELTSQVFNGADSHTITLSLLNILRPFSWGTKASLTTLAFILTFGDNGLNLCPQSKLSYNHLPSFVTHLLDITHTIVYFDRFYLTQSPLFMTSKDPKIMTARTRYIVSIYWIIRATMATSTSHIKAISCTNDKVSMATPSMWYKKLKLINGHLNTTLDEVYKLLILDNYNKINIEDYERIKDNVHKYNHIDNKEVLNELLSGKDGTLNLYYGPDNKKVVHLDVFHNKHVLLVMSSMGLFKEMHVIDTLMKSKQRDDVPFEMVWIPIIDYNDDDSIVQPSQFNNFESLRNSSWYSIENPWVMKNEVLKLFKDNWHYHGEPMIVVLDPRGNIVNKNAINMVMIWKELAFPFTREKEQELWKHQDWSLDFVVANIDHQVREWISEGKYILMYGGGDIEWIRKLTKTVQDVASKCQVGVEMLYVGKSHNEELIESKFLSEAIDIWYFWRRLESMVSSMDLDRDHDVMLKIQQLQNWGHNSLEWGILAKGSTILVNGHGQVVLSTLNEFDLWKEEAYNEGFGTGFQSHYNKLYQKKMPFRSLMFPIDAFALPNNSMSLDCVDCKCKMKCYVNCICYHPLSTNSK